MIQTRLNTLFVCEIKFSKNELNTAIISEMKEKINNLSIPRKFSCVPILIHVNGVTDDVIDQAYFYKIIDWGELLISNEND